MHVLRRAVLIIVSCSRYFDSVPQSHLHVKPATQLSSTSRRILTAAPVVASEREGTVGSAHTAARYRNEFNSQASVCSDTEFTSESDAEDEFFGDLLRDPMMLS